MGYRISLIQANFPPGELEENYQKAQKLVENAADQSANLVLLPELWVCGFDLKNSQEYASQHNQGWFKKMHKLAVDYQVGLGGSIIEQEGKILYNTFVLFDPQDGLIGKYRKIHLFQKLQEQDFFEAGSKLELIDSRWGKIGLAVCYDLRFPEIFRAYAARNAQLILIVAEWPQKRIKHWSTLLQARAIENQVYIAAVNKVGQSLGLELGGFSAIVDPGGEFLASGDLTEQIIGAEIDLDEVNKTRDWMPVLKDRKPLLYKEFLSD
jgi:predicted amidohydrolase